MEAAVARDAATLVLLRDGAAGLETVLLRRSAELAFVGGAHVFPGGALDASDADAFVGGISDEEASARVGVGTGGRAFWAAAVRECLEEAGVLAGVGTPVPPAPGELRRARRDLQSGTASMVEVLGRLGATIDAGRVHCVARWITPEASPRRFDARFFVTAMPAEQEVVVDGGELVSHRWSTPAEALGRHRRGDIELILPTVRTLMWLQHFGTLAEVLEDARRLERDGPPGPGEVAQPSAGGPGGPVG